MHLPTYCVDLRQLLPTASVTLSFSWCEKSINLTWGGSSVPAMRLCHVRRGSSARLTTTTASNSKKNLFLYVDEAISAPDSLSKANMLNATAPGQSGVDALCPVFDLKQSNQPLNQAVDCP